ncbi:MAG TPA: phosphate starvation-inducible protein PhoH, partial [Phaeodactylibacter sp.]|nr:phosphate starvation-inducible protein PhoH [Phaeodactylibacter sp.]
MTVEGVDFRELYGENDAKLNLLRRAFPEISITARGSHLRLLGEKKQTQRAKAKFEAMVRVVREQDELSTQTIHRLLGEEHAQVFEKGDTLLYGRSSRRIAAKTPNQRRL